MTMFGYTKEELIGQSVEILMPERFCEHHTNLRKAFSQEPATRAMGTGRNLTGRRKDGSEFPVEVGLCPIKTDEGLVVWSSLVDITMRKQAEEALKNLARLKDDFIGTVSHELRTPLTVINLGLENLQAGIFGPLGEKQAEAIERNIRNAKRLGKLIDNLLDLSRLQSGRTKIEKKAVGLKHLIHEVIQSFQPGEKAGTAFFQEEMPANLPPLECDPDLIAQVLTNLLSNAIRYAKEKIAVKSEVIKGAVGTPEFIQTSVVNDGPGIPQEKLAELFNKFVQLDRGQRKGSYKGTGLGLAICKEIIEKHHGKIWAENPKEGGGVAFCFTLPIHKDGE